MSTPKCLIEGCSRLSAPALKRGLCMTCYVRAKKMVEAGQTTWVDLAKLGLVLSREESSGDDPFTSAYDRATKQD